MRRRAGRAAVLGGHVATAASFGALAGLALFAAEAALPYRGQYVVLGDPVLRVLSIYLLSAVAAGTVFGLVVGLAGVLAGRLLSAARFVPFHAGAFVFLTSSYWFLRNHPLSALGRLWASADGAAVVVFLLAGIAVGAAIGRVVARRAHPPRTSPLAAVAGISLLLGIVLWVGQGSGHMRLPGRAGDAAGPNVVLIVLDALRADHMSAYGYERTTTPNIDRLAREGIVFRNARSHGNRTVLAMPSVFTSLYPSFHGAISRGELIRPLPSERVTIAELFQQAGYTSVGLMTNIYLKSIFGMTQGFDRVEEFNAGCYGLSVYRALHKLGLLERPAYVASGSPDASAVTDRGLAWLERLRDRPFLLYMHYMDTHHPYTAPERFERAFHPSPESRDSEALFRDTVQLLKEGRARELPPHDLAALRDYYDATILYADHEIGRILDRVREISRQRETLVIITADHGDEFLEHGTLYHNNLLIEQLIRVPLIVWAPDRFPGGRSIESLVRHIDILPTLAGLIGRPAPPETMGTSLAPLLAGDESDLGLTSISEGDFCTALIRGNWKVMYVDSTDTAHLYDLATDPEEKRDLSAARPDVMADLMMQLDLYLEKARDVDHRREAQADAETIRQLKALGYL
ncbi:MAG: sulfatase [Candidatus Krumholzibacteriia bacterium]